MKLNKLAILAPLTLALAISQNLQAAPALNDLVTLEKPSISERSRANSPMYNVKANENGERILDMTNKAHFKFAKQRLLKANMSEADYPQLHQSLHDLKRQQEITKSLIGNGEPINATATASADLIKNSHMFLNMQVAVSPIDNQAYLIVRAESTVYGGTNSTFVDLLLENASYGQLAPMGATFTVLEGKQVYAISSVSLDTLKAQNPNLDTIFASSWVETEEADGTLTSGLRFTEYPWDWDYMNAQYGANMKSVTVGAQTTIQTIADGGRPVYTATAPIDLNTDGVIKICLNRNHADCDYAADQYQDPNSITDVNIPFKGQITVPHKIDQIYASNTQPNGINEATNIYLQEGVYGGATKQTFVGLNGNKSFSDYLTFEVDTTNKQTIISWDIPREEGRFGNAMLFSNIAEADWRLNFAVKGTAYFNTRGRASNFQLQVNSNNIDGMTNFYTQSLEKIKLGYSCLARGTMITMADGTQKAIEDILNGDMVMGALAQSSLAVQPMKVVDTSIGVEALKMFRIYTANGEEILMTETHPVSTANKGIVWGKELKKGDRILTADGSVVITKIKKEKYKDNVYNLKLAPVEGSTIAPGQYLGMFANGLLVGDLDTQDEHNYKDQYIRETPAEKLQRMPEKWKADYISSLNSSK
ncbi:MAG: Hint domain-containing protein [Psychrosphaera sp.]|nr:Hint domain-containing protein [Psychrosphaera sp.]